MKFISLNLDHTKDMIMPLSNTPPVPAVYSASVAGLGAEDPTTVTFTKDAGFPTSFQEWTDADNNVFVKIPTMYRTIDNIADGQITAFTISTAPISEDSQPYSVFVKPNGDIMPYVCIGKYCSHGNYGYLDSVGDNITMMKIGTARDSAKENGVGYQQYDWQFQKLFIDIALVISQKVNFQDGTTVISDYLGVNHLNENIWVDGVSMYSSEWVVAKNPVNYVDEATSSSYGYIATSYVPPSASTSMNIKKLGYDISNPFFNYPNDVVSDSTYTTYYCDACAIADARPITARVGYNNAADGLFRATPNTWAGTRYARLCYRPLSLTI